MNKDFINSLWPGQLLIQNNNYFAKQLTFLI